MLHRAQGTAWKARAALGAVLALSTIPASVAFAGDPLRIGANPLLRTQIDAEASRIADRQNLLDTPAAQEARSASRFRWANLDEAGAFNSLAAEHPDLSALPTWQPLAGLEGMRLTSNRDHTSIRAARETEEGQGSILVESTLPMEAQDSGGRFAPVDLTLVAGPDARAPRNALVPIALPNQLSARVRVGDLLAIGIPGAPPAHGRSAGNAVFYANAERDTDVIVRPLPAGAEVYEVLRSASSPERLDLDLGLADGVTTRLPSDSLTGAIELRRGDSVVGAVGAPRAWDADGRPVALSYDVTGDRVSVSVPHRDGDFAYPIVVDPVVEDYEWQNYGPNNGTTAGWIYAGDTNRFMPFFGDAYLGRGFYIRDLWNNAWFSSNEAGYIYYPGPLGAKIYALSLLWINVDYPVNNICNFGGILSGDVLSWDAVYTHCDYWNDASMYLNPMNGGTLGNKAVWGAMVNGDGYRDYFMQQLGGATIWMKDYATLTVGVDSIPGGWVTDPNASMSFTARQDGFGVQSMVASATNSGSWSGARTLTWQCTGGNLNPCPHVANLTTTVGNLPDGPSTIHVTAWDGTRQVAAPDQNINVDRNPPLVVPSDELWDDRGVQGGMPGSAPLTVKAIDAGSGTAGITLTVDGATVSTQSQSCAGGACTSTFNVSQAPGSHHVRVDAVDQVGHQSTPVEWDVRYYDPDSKVGDDEPDVIDGTPVPISDLDYCADAGGVCNGEEDTGVIATTAKAGAVNAQLGKDGIGWGLSDENPATFSDTLFDQLGVHAVRLIVPWDTVYSGDTARIYRCKGTSVSHTLKYNVDAIQGLGSIDGALKIKDWLKISDDWIRAAKEKGLDVLVSFERTAYGGLYCYAPTAAEYATAVQMFLDRHPDVDRYTAWNEPNQGGQPTSSSQMPKKAGAELAGSYWRKLQTLCHSGGRTCIVGAGDFADPISLSNSDPTSYYHYYIGGTRSGSKPPPGVWAFHPYQQAADGKTDRLSKLISSSTRVYGGNKRYPSIWISEVGGRVHKYGLVDATAHFANALKLFPTLNDRITRFYAYSWKGASYWDSGLLDYNTGVARKMYTKYKYCIANGAGSRCTNYTP
jgi:hypothetical protein